MRISASVKGLLGLAEGRVMSMRIAYGELLQLAQVVIALVDLLIKIGKK